MSRFLLDTHVFIWLINGEGGIGPNCLSAIIDPENEVYVSYFSLFEIIIKAQTGKASFSSAIIDRLQEVNVELLMPDTALLHHYRIFNERNKDPFDNVLLTTALYHDLTLLTNDHKMLAVQGVNMLEALR